MNKININKKLQKFVNRTVLLDGTKVRIAKKLNNAMTNFGELEERAVGQMQELNFNEVKNAYDKILEELEQTEKEQSIQIIHLKQQLKIIEKKVTCLENILTKDNLISEADRKNEYKKRLRLHLLNISSGLHIDQHTPPDIIRGFSMLKTPSFSMKPFELNVSAISEDESMDKIWDLTKMTSYHITEWENLFYT